MTCEYGCYVIGGGFIAENPECPVHGVNGLDSHVEKLEWELNEARADLEQCRVQLAGCGVIAGCNTRTTLAEQLPTPDSYGYSASLLDVAKAVTREMNERERAEASEHNFAIEHGALVKAERDLAAANAEREALRQDAERLAAIESWGGAHIIHWGDDSEWTVGRCCDLDRDPTADDYAGETLRAAIDAAIDSAREGKP